MAVTIYQSGRLGNCFFSQAFLMAYAKKHGLEYYTPINADAYKDHNSHNRNPFAYIPSTSTSHFFNKRFTEANIHTIPSYQEIPKMDNTIFDGYYQTFLYFDWCRPYILKQFNLPQNPSDYTSISLRHGDCKSSPNFPICSQEYYQKAIQYMMDKGFNKFKVFGDDLPFAVKYLNSNIYPNATFEYSDGKNEMQDYIDISNCKNNITARSTFSLTASWMNQNPTKIVCVPSDEKFKWWRGQNLDLLTNTKFVKINFEKSFDEWNN